MQISNNYQPNFGDARVTKSAKYALRRRLGSDAKVEEFIKKFQDTYKDSEFKLAMSTVSNKSKELDVMIHYEKPNTESCTSDCKEIYQESFFRHEEEGFISSLCRSPYAFAKRIKKIYDKYAVPFANNGFKHVID